MVKTVIVAKLFQVVLARKQFFSAPENWLQRCAIESPDVTQPQADLKIKQGTQSLRTLTLFHWPKEPNSDLLQANCRQAEVLSRLQIRFGN